MARHLVFCSHATPDGTVRNNWHEELNGPLAETARKFLLNQGKPACLLLSTHWSSLGENNRQWLFSWATRLFPAEGVGLVLSALNDPSDAVKTAGSEAVITYGECKQLFHKLLATIELTDNTSEILACGDSCRCID